MQSAKNQIVLDRLIEEETPALGRDRRQSPRDAVGGKGRDIDVADADGAAPLLDEAHDRLERRGLAGAVGAEQRDGLAAADS